MRISGAIFGCTACLVVAGVASAQEWKPARNVDIVVASGAGGSSDRTARVVQRLLQANPAFPSISVSNRQGGGGTVAWSIFFRSVQQTPQQAIRTSSSPGPQSGRGTSSTRTSRRPR